MHPVPLAIALLAMHAPEPPAPPAPAAPDLPAKLRIVHIKLRGDLDCTRLTSDLQSTLRKAREDSAEVLLLELDGNRWRGDVLLGMAQSLSSTSREGMKLWVLLADALDNRIGSGQAALGLLADRCYLHPKAQILFDPGDDLRELAPDGTGFEQIDHDLQGLLWAAARERGRDGLLAALLPTPRQQVWALRGAEGPFDRLTGSTPESDASALALSSPATESPQGDAFQLRLSTEAAVGIGIASAQARDLGHVFALERVAPRPLIRRELVSALPEARKTLADRWSQVDAVRRRIDKALDEAERLRGHDSPRRKLIAGRESLAPLVEASARLSQIETLLTDYPELLRAAPPGTTSIELTPQRLSRAWFESLQDRRDNLADLKARAERLAEPASNR